MSLTESNYEMLAKNNFIVAKALATIVVLATLFNPPIEAILGILTILAAVFSTISTYAWMSR